MNEFKCVVRVQTEAYRRGNAYFYGKSLRVLQKQTTFDILKEECENIGTTDGLENIINLQNVADGTYSLTAVNISTDCESGYIDDWDLKLIPHQA